MNPTESAKNRVWNSNQRLKTQAITDAFRVEPIRSRKGGLGRGYIWHLPTNTEIEIFPKIEGIRYAKICFYDGYEAVDRNIHLVPISEIQTNGSDSVEFKTQLPLGERTITVTSKGAVKEDTIFQRDPTLAVGKLLANPISNSYGGPERI